MQWFNSLHVAAAAGCLRFLQSLVCATVCQSGPTTTTSCLPSLNMSGIFLPWSDRKGGRCVTRPAVRWVLLLWGCLPDTSQVFSPHITHKFLSFCTFYQYSHLSLSCTFFLQTTWDESDTSHRLRDRVWDVARWKEVLESCAQKVDEEMEALTLVICPKTSNDYQFLFGKIQRYQPM